MKDFVACFTRWYQATKSTNQAMATKVDSLKDEMDEALNKVEACKVGVAFNQEGFIRLASLPVSRGVNSASKRQHLEIKGQNCAIWCSPWKLNCVLHPAGPALCRLVHLCL